MAAMKIDFIGFYLSFMAYANRNIGDQLCLTGQNIINKVVWICLKFVKQRNVLRKNVRY